MYLLLGLTLAVVIWIGWMILTAPTFEEKEDGSMEYIHNKKD